MPGPTIYTYGPEDDPLSVASQFGITPNALLKANPGGSPFSVGQSIKIPAVYQYAAPIGPQSPSLLSQWQAKGPTPPNGLLGTGYQNQPGAQRVPVMQTLRSPDRTPGSNPMSPMQLFASLTRPSTAPDRPPAPGSLRWALGERPAGTLGEGDFYGYERDPETGRSVRVVKNSATSNFLNEQRWDPQARKYVSIARLLKQGKLDLQGNWHKQSRRQRRNDNAARKQGQKKQDFTLANSLISFGASSG